MTSSPLGSLPRSGLVDLTADEPAPDQPTANQPRTASDIEIQQPSAPLPWWQLGQRVMSGSDGRLVDKLLIALVVAVAAFRRRGVLPVDGYWHDDAWVVTSIRHGELSGFFSTTGGVPGFVWLHKAALLLGPPELVIPVAGLVLGLLLPVVGYGVVKLVAGTRWPATGFAAVLALAPQYVEYSGRVKSYNLDAIVVLGLFAYGWHSADHNPSPRRLLGEVLGLAAISTISPWAALAAVSFIGARIVILGFRRWRLALLAVGAAITVAASQLYMRSGYNGERVNDAWRGYGAFPESGALNLPFDLAYRVTQVLRLLVPGPDWVRFIALAAVAAGLWMSWRHSRLLGLYLVTMLAASALATSIGRMPFGGESLRVLRGSMWLAPLLLVLAVLAVNRAGVAGSERWGFRSGGFVATLGVALVGLAVLLATTTLPRQELYELDGLESALAFYQGSRGEDDFLFAANGSHRSVTAALDSGVHLVADEQSGHGYKTIVNRQDMVFTLPEVRKVLGRQPHANGSTNIYVLTVHPWRNEERVAEFYDLLRDSGRSRSAEMVDRIVRLEVWSAG